MLEPVIKWFDGVCRTMWHLVKCWNMLRYVYTIDYQRNYERSSTHMCQIVGIPSHSRVELQLIQDTKNDLYYYRGKEWNQHAIRILVRFDKNIGFLKIVILKMNRKWTSVNTCCIFASFDTYLRCYTFTKMVI